MIILIFAIEKYDTEEQFIIVDEKFFIENGHVRDYSYQFIDAYLPEGFYEVMESTWCYHGTVQEGIAALEQAGLKFSQELQGVAESNTIYLDYVAEKELLKG